MTRSNGRFLSLVLDTIRPGSLLSSPETFSSLCFHDLALSWFWSFLAGTFQFALQVPLLQFYNQGLKFRVLFSLMLSSRRVSSFSLVAISAYPLHNSQICLCSHKYLLHSHFPCCPLHIHTFSHLCNLSYIAASHLFGV